MRCTARSSTTMAAKRMATAATRRAVPSSSSNHRVLGRSCTSPGVSNNNNTRALHLRPRALLKRKPGEEATEEEQNMETTTTTSMTSLSDEARKIGEAVAEGAHAFTERYDLLSAFSGSMCVTGYCVLRGQEPWTALMITATATVTALVINELMEDPM
ncbi:hypothetical protein HKI87_10g61000 [Chloropicon roscoffensis]|uniref:Uncharacterized protein n=1 Tax=Chloropicon roscoffensis TaxID=1461544 RepID=A0AAX4PF48_9CHLO